MRLWEEFLKEQARQIGAETVAKWLQPLKVKKYDAANLYLEASDALFALWFEEHIRPKLGKKFCNNNGRPIRVHLSFPSERKQPAREWKKEEPDWRIDSLDPSFTLEQFVLSEKNLLVHRLIYQLVAEKTSGSELGAFNPIYIHGPVGTGKTHLLIAIAHALKNQGLHVLYCRSETFTDHVVKAIRSSSMKEFRKIYRNVDVLLLDNVQSFSGKKATQEELFHTFNELHLAGKQIVMAADVAPRELKDIEPRLVSRFEWGIVLSVELLSKSEQATMLENKCQHFQLHLNEKVCAYLQDTFTSSTKSLVKAVEALVLRTEAKPTPTSPQAAREMLSDLILEEEKSRINPEKILLTVSEKFGMKIEELTGKTQKKECTIPRQIAMYLCRDVLRLPFMKIGDLFSRDHSTVMSSIKIVKEEIEGGNKEISTILRSIHNKL